MKSFWNAIDGSKTYSAIGILALAGTLFPLLGVPAIATTVVVTLGTALGIVGRIHAGAKIADVKGEIATVAGQVDAIRKYVQVAKNEK
jgi:hypothetical protein